MRRLLCLFFIIGCVCFSVEPQFELPPMPWFDHVKTPLKMTDAQLCDVAMRLRQFLKENEKIEKLDAILPNEEGGRVVFITIGGDYWPGRFYYGCGMDFKSAVKNAVTFLRQGEAAYAASTVKLAKAKIADAKKNNKNLPKEWQEREKHPSDWDWLRLNVVQYSRPTANFSLTRSRIALTSLVGIAFGPGLGFAFLPEQLTGRYLVTDTSHIAVQQVCNLITENHNFTALQIWMEMNNVPKGFRICLFETDAYFADANGAYRLYRGHQLPKTLPTAINCLEMAMQNADNLILKLDEKSGKFRKPVPEWVCSTEKSERFDEIAAFAIALCRLSRESRQPRYAEAARLALTPVLKHFTASPLDKKNASVIVEREQLPPKALYEPRKLATIRTNALTCLALLELAECNTPLKADNVEMAYRLAKHIASQKFGGVFYHSIFAEDGKTFTERDDIYADTRSNCLAWMALKRMKQFRPDFKGADGMQAAFETMLQEKIVNMPLEEIVCEPALMEALAMVTPNDKSHVLSMVKAGYGASCSLETAPLYPDYYGSIKGRPSCTQTAARTWFMLALSKWLREQEKPTWAQEQLGNALPMIMFQQQGFMDRGGATSMASVKPYVGLFRDNLETYGFNLRGQSTQLMSLVAAARELKALEVLKKDSILSRIMASRKTTDVHPSALNVNVVSSTDNDINPKSHALTGVGGEIKSSQVKAEKKQPQQQQEPVKKQGGRRRKK